jgi:RHS repeat-associated protein
VSQPAPNPREIDASSSAFAPPSLPKGGGAIRGIGEKLSPNLVTGTGALTIPIATTPGRSGFGPELALSYDSANGNGPFGIGWTLSTLHITRRTDRGLPRYEDADDSDIFLLSGFDDLVPSRRPGDDFFDEARGVHVRRYRPRVEGSFTRIERLTDGTTGDVSWSLTMHDGTIHRFGVTAAARVADPTNARRTFEWRLEESRDRRGNVVQYIYKREDDAQVLPVPAEDSRHGPQAGLYLKRIYYGNRAPDGAADWCFQVVFDYGEHGAVDPSTETGEPATWPTPDDTKRPWTYRADPFSNYRAGFEVRTRRLCRRVLSFHRFDELGSGDWTLVRSTDFAHVATPVATYLHKATQTGWMPGATKSLPPLEMGYAQPAVDTNIRELDPGALDGLRGGIDPGKHEWVDVDGEGIAGLLFREAGAWWYKRNLGKAGLAAPERLPSIPSRLDEGPPRLVDLAGAGVKDFVVYDRAGPGFYERTDDEDWTPFRTFASMPNVDFGDPNLRQLDLDGDGLADVLVNEDQAFVVHLSEGRRGFGAGSRVRKSSDERLGPALALQEPLQTIFLADMTGDGLTDLVRIRNGEIAYWPNLGYGRFGAKVTMGGAPVFDRPEAFDPARLRLGDIDGSGTTDIVYLGVDGAVAYFNQAGNAWSAPQPLRGFPPPTKFKSVQLLDLLGNGTSCLVWTSAAPASEGQPLRYLDLMGGLKPHLLVSLDNHLGRQVSLTYAPSTQFYLADRLAGTPWVTRLPFPVHVVVRAETNDLVARTRIVTRYAYHHGYFDGFEREFRGFGRVDAYDTESFGVAGDAGASEFDLPTVVTKTWFHTGVFPGDGNVAKHLAAEYYPGDPVSLGETLLPGGLGVDDTREACRALKGKMLREEVYALDGQSDVPYIVREHAYALVPVELEGGRAHGVWFPHARESLEIHYERQANDPRITHALTLAVDDYGNVTDEASVAYERRAGAVRTQGERIVTYTHRTVTNIDTRTSYFVGLPVRAEAFEVLGLGAAPGQLVKLDDAAASTRDAYANKRWIGMDETPPGLLPVTLRELSRSRTLYWDNGQTQALPEGEVGARALQRSADTKVYSTGQPARLYSPRLDAATLASVLGGDCKLTDVDADGGWWAPSPVVTYDTTFYQPVSQTDPFGNTTTLERENKYKMFVTSVVDPLKNIVRTLPDYRVAAPAQVTDPNWTGSVATYDPLGRIVSVTMTGTDGAGNTLTGTTANFEYFLDGWDEAPRKPAYVHARVRNDWGANPTYQESYTYTDGSGREAMKKVQAEPGPAPQLDANGRVVRDAQGNPVPVNVNPRWVGSGRTVFDNKGNPVKKYEPYFSGTSDYEDEPELVEWGVTPILRYDPVGRLVQTDFPDKTLSRVVFDAWTVEHWDQNDTVEESGWYQAIKNPAPGQPAPSQQLVRAADLTYKHRQTPSRDILDPVGRTVSSIVNLGRGATLETKYDLDAAGNVTLITDPRGIRTSQAFDMAKRAARTISPDAGDRALIYDAGGATARALTAMGYAIVHTYDEARRPILVHRLDYGEAPGQRGTLVERTIYGEALDPLQDSENAPTARRINARGRVYERYDGAGLEMYERYDLKGNLGRVRRRMTKAYQTTPTWDAIDDPDANVPLATINANAMPLLEDETFVTETDYDALDRPKRIVTADRSEAYPTYNEAGLLETIGVRLRGSAALTPFVTNLDYNARGQRILCQHANGADTSFDYDPNTFRLRELKTARAAGTVQDCTYTYDPVGNVVEVDDPAEDAWFGSAPGSGSLLYEYDAAYRLTSGSGREQGTNGQIVPPGGVEAPLFPIPDPNDTARVRQYRETFEYNDSGDLTKITHDILNVPGLPGWVRPIPTDTGSNRLAPRDDAGVLTGYGYDAHGNMTSANGQVLRWNYADRLESVDLVGGGRAYYSYDASGNRVRKVVERTAALVQRRDYIGNWERYRSATSGNVDLERETLRVMDDKQCVALVETKTIEAGVAGPMPETRTRWQIGNHLGSVAIELDESAGVISYEEYYPYGGTAYLARTGVVQSSFKRYRYQGKERDEETGLYYYGARYYACWLGRWLSVDPVTKNGGAFKTNLFQFVRGNPLRYFDPDGKDEKSFHVTTTDRREDERASNRKIWDAMSLDERQHEIARLNPILGNRAEEYWRDLGVAGTSNPVIEEITRPDKFQGIIELGKLQLTIASHIFGEIPAVGAALKVIGAFQTGTSTGQFLYGYDWDGRELSLKERLWQGGQALLGWIGILGEARALGGRGPKGKLGSTPEPTAGARPIPPKPAGSPGIPPGDATPSPALKGSPYHPDSVAARVRPPYEPVHAGKGYVGNPKKTPEPADAAAVYQNATRTGMGTWWGRGEGGWYRYFFNNVGNVHFTGTFPTPH